MGIVVPMDVGELAPGLWWWTARHPDWEPTRSWPAEVRSFYVETDDVTLVVDPLVPDGEEDAFWTALDRDVERRVQPMAVLLTEAAHSRHAGVVATRYGGEVWGPAQAGEKVGGAPFHTVAPGDRVPGGRALEFDQVPSGSGAPLYFPSHAAIAVGDVFISRGGSLYVWWGHGAADDAWYTKRLLPSLRRWLDVPTRHVLVAHGNLVAPDELAAALERAPDRGA